MNIVYLTQLKDNPAKYPNDNENRFEITGISETQIAQLEQSYNNGNPFPKVLKELLYLAGNYCYIFDTGDSQQDLQDWFRDLMIRYNKSISRPFYVIDTNQGDDFRIIYLNEGDNPLIYDASPDVTGEEWIKLNPLNDTIQSLVNYLIKQIKENQD
jgi:hypothetical protein